MPKSTSELLHEKSLEAMQRRADNAELRARVERLEGVVRKCAEKFREYEALHARKATPEGLDKQIRNAEMAMMCESVLAQHTCSGIPNGGANSPEIPDGSEKKARNIMMEHLNANSKRNEAYFGSDAYKQAIQPTHQSGSCPNAEGGAE